MRCPIHIFNNSFLYDSTNDIRRWKITFAVYLVLKEIGGDFGPRVEKKLFKPTNVFVSASKSGKLTSGKKYSNYTFLQQIKYYKSNQIKYFFFSTNHFKQWLTENYFPNVSDNGALSNSS